MIKFSQLPDAVNAVGGEILPIVQEHETRKAKAVFVGPNNKLIIPEGVEIVTIADGEEVKLLTAKVIDGSTHVYVGDADFNLYKGDVPVVTEDTKTDGNAYVRINNSWTIRNPITSINSKRPLTGGGDVLISSSDVNSHQNNTNKDGQSYVSRDGSWIKLTDILTPLLNGKANTVHSHEVSDVNTLQESLTRIEAKADNYAHDPAYGSMSVENKVIINSGILEFDKQLLVEIDHSPEVLTIRKPGYYMITLSGKGVGSGEFQVQLNDQTVSTLTVDADGKFSVQDIIDIPINATIKVRHETSGELTASLVVTIHRM